MQVWINMNDFLSFFGSARGAHRGSNEPCSPVVKTLLGPNGPKNHPKAPQGSKITRKHRFSSIFVWCSDVICHIILARDSLAAFQASQDKTKIAIVAPSFHSIRLHISQGEYPHPPSTCERKNNSASYVQARRRGWPAGQLDIYIYIYIYIYIFLFSIIQYIFCISQHVCIYIYIYI